MSMLKFLDQFIKLAGRLFAGCLVGCAIAWFMKGRLPPAVQIDPRLQQQPRQTKTTRPPFDFNYRGATYHVTPMAEYEIWGLVVSHNNINSMADIYHNKDSVDIKDLALIWGSNVKTDDYRRVTYRSNSYIVEFRYPHGVHFDHAEISNNHLLASDAAVRKAIGDVRIGDQVHLRGMLVNYTSPKMGGERKSSLTRKDTAMGACEVVFVEQINHLKRGTPVWVFVYRAAFYGGLAAIAAAIAALFLRFSLEQRALDRKRANTE